MLMFCIGILNKLIFALSADVQPIAEVKEAAAIAPSGTDHVVIVTSFKVFLASYATNGVTHFVIALCGEKKS